jgi:hypothetical protein
LDGAAQRATFTNDLVLTDVLIERARPHSCG